jgi:hypothetical protein
MALAGDHVIVKMDDSGGTLRTFANGDITSVDVPLTNDQHDVTGFGDAAHHVINGQLQAPVTIKGYLTTTASVGTHTVIKGAHQTQNQVTFRAAVGNKTRHPPPATRSTAASSMWRTTRSCWKRARR